MEYRLQGSPDWPALYAIFGRLECEGLAALAAARDYALRFTLARGQPFSRGLKIDGSGIAKRSNPLPIKSRKRSRLSSPTRRGCLRLNRFADVGNPVIPDCVTSRSPISRPRVVVVIVVEDEILIRLPVVSALEMADNSRQCCRGAIMHLRLCPSELANTTALMNPERGTRHGAVTGGCRIGQPRAYNNASSGRYRCANRVAAARLREDRYLRKRSNKSRRSAG